MSNFIHWEDLPIVQDNGLPPKAYYSLEDAANILKCSKNDVLHYAATDRIEIVASMDVLDVACIIEGAGDRNKEDKRPVAVDFCSIYAHAARELELTGLTYLSYAVWGYEVDGPGVGGGPPWNYERRFPGGYRFHRDESVADDGDWDDGSENYSNVIEDLAVTPDAVYVMATALSRFKKGEPVFPFSPTPPAAQNEQIQRHRKPHGNTERFAVNREAVLKAAMYCKEMWPEQCSAENYREWATVVDEKAKLFWPDTAAPPLSVDQIERLLGKAHKLPGDVE